MQRFRILYIYPGPNPPPAKEEWDKHCYLSRMAEGDVLLPVWWTSDQEMAERFPPERHAAGKFRYHVYRFFKYKPPLRSAAQLLFYISRGRRAFRENAYEAIVCYGWNIPGLAAVLLSVLTGAKLILEVPGVPEKAYLFETPDAPPPPAWKQRLSAAMLNLCIKKAARIRLLFPAQLSSFPAAAHKPTSVFHEFVPVTVLNPSTLNDGYLLFVGYPWYLKGVDILLKAFREISPKFPGCKLKVVGWCTDRAPFEKLAEGLPVEFLPGQSFEETVKLMSGCSAFVLPSRTEAMGRVLLEAMAIGKPIVAARVDGIPHYVEHETTGLLFERENVADLAANLERVLSDEALRARLILTAGERVRAKYSEVAYTTAFESMLHATLRARGTA